MVKEYVTPVMDVTAFENEDVITASGTDIDDGGGD